MPYRGLEDELPEIPVFDCGTLGAAHLVEMALPRARRMMEIGARNLTMPVLALADWRSRGWLARNETPYAQEIDRIAKRVEAGTAASEQARATGAGAKPLAELGWQFAQRG